MTVRAETSAHGVRWHTHHYGIELPGWATIVASIGTAIRKGRREEKGKPGWSVLLLALALGVLAIWTLSLTQPYQPVSG